MLDAPLDAQVTCTPIETHGLKSQPPPSTIQQIDWQTHLRPKDMQESFDLPTAVKISSVR